MPRRRGSECVGDNAWPAAVVSREAPPPPLRRLLRPGLLDKPVMRHGTISTARGLLHE